MSAVSSVDCPVCGGYQDMMEDYFFKQGEIFYHCHSCGYGNLFRELKEGNNTYWIWDHRCERRKFLKKVNLKKKHGLHFVGRVPFYPIEVELPEYMVYPRSKKGKLVWKLYSPDRKLLGENKSMGGAFRAGDEHVDRMNK